MPQIEHCITPDDRLTELHTAVRDGLTRHPKTLPPKWFYDARGSDLFERITTLDEYYPTRAERAILAAHSERIADTGEVGTLIELGSGSSDKTPLLLDALHATGSLRRYVPVDVSDSALRDAAERLTATYPELEITPVVADFDHGLETQNARSDGAARMVAILGGTIGNFPPEQRVALLHRLRSGLRPDDRLLIGADLVKEPARLTAAYDDAAGVTAEFNRNMLHVINRTLDANFAPAEFDHVAIWDPINQWVEMRLRSTHEQRVWINALDLSIHLADGEDIRTEISAKFHRKQLRTEFENTDFELSHWWTDPHGDYALALAIAR